MNVHPIPPPELREPRVAPRLLAALSAGAVACVAVAVLLSYPPSALVALAVGLLLGVTVAVIATLGRTGRGHLTAPAEPEPALVVTVPDDDLLALAAAVQVYRPGRHVFVPPCDTPTGVIPAVAAEVTS